MPSADVQKTLDERGATYGSFFDGATVSQQLQQIIQHGYEDAHPLNHYYQLPADVKESLTMISHKIARIVNGDPLYAESWRDIAGYAQLVVQRLNETEGATDARVVRQVVRDGELQDV